MTNFSFTKIDVPAAAGSYTYIGVSGLNASGDAVGYYGNVDGDGDGSFHGFIALVNGNGITLDPPAQPTPALALPQAGSSSETIPISIINMASSTTAASLRRSIAASQRLLPPPFHLLSAPTWTALPTPA
jgi:hypothetical protein